MTLLTTAPLVAAFVAATSIAAFAADAPPTDQLAHGKYIATAADCQSCHTSNPDQPFVGGVELKTPFGTLAAPNITPDKETGIGNWTRADFEGALRHGIAKSGLPLYPGMPYTSYTKMTDADLDALWAYMRTVAPVKHDVTVNRLPFPFNVRPSVYAWQAMFFEADRFQPDPSKSAEFNRGAYLVEALAHCSSCHTPRNALGAQINSRFLQGGKIEEWFAPDISNGEASTIRDWSKARLTNFLRGHTAAHRVTPFGQMAKVVYDSLSQLTAEDVGAIAAYLKERKPGETGTKPQFVSLTTEQRDTGRGIYEGRCMSCHGKSGEGVAGLGAKLAGNEAVSKAKPYNVLSVLLEGIEPHGIWGTMPPFADTSRTSRSPMWPTMCARRGAMTLRPGSPPTTSAGGGMLSRSRARRCARRCPVRTSPPTGWTTNCVWSCGRSASTTSTGPR